MIWKVLVVLVSGNIVVIKFVFYILLSVVMFGEIVNEVGLFFGVLNIIIGLGNMVGIIMFIYLFVCCILFVGESNIGKMVMWNVVENLIFVLLEFGGKLVNIVFEDVDLDEVVKGFIEVIYWN